MDISTLLDEYFVNPSFIALLKQKRESLGVERVVTLKRTEYLNKILLQEEFFIFRPGVFPRIEFLKYDKIITHQGYLFSNDKIHLAIYSRGVLLDRHVLSIDEVYDVYKILTVPEMLPEIEVHYTIIPDPENDYIKLLEEVDKDMVYRVLNEVSKLIPMQAYDRFVFLHNTSNLSIPDFTIFIKDLIKKNLGIIERIYYIDCLDKFMKTNDLYYLFLVFENKKGDNIFTSLFKKITGLIKLFGF